MPVPKLEEFKAPWEVKDGQPVADADQVIDKAQLKTYLWNVLNDKDKLQTRVSEKDTKITELETKVTEKSQEGLTEIQKLQQSVEALTGQAAKAELERAKLELIQDNGLEKGDIAFLTGADLDANKAIAEQLKARVGEKKTTDKDGDDGGKNPVDTTPKETVNPGDRKQTGSGTELTADQFRDRFRAKQSNPFGN